MTIAIDGQGTSFCMRPMHAPCVNVVSCNQTDRLFATCIGGSDIRLAFGSAPTGKEGWLLLQAKKRN